MYEKRPLSLVAISINISLVVSCTCVVIYSLVSSLITTTTTAALVAIKIPDVCVLLIHVAGLATPVQKRFILNHYTQVRFFFENGEIHKK